MLFIKERVGKLIDDLEGLIYRNPLKITSYKYFKSEEKFSNIEAIETSEWKEITNQELWGGHEEYYWFETFVTIPKEYDGECVVYELKTGREGEWDATNPQFTIYVNDRRVQGLDVNHRDIILTECANAGDIYRIVLSAFTGVQNFRLLMDSGIKILDRKTEKYFYDLKVPYQVAEMLKKTERDFIIIIKALNTSLNLLDLRKEYSIQYYESLENAQVYITKEFYEKHCGNSKEVIYCIGHTHIDVAWMWTLSVTRDKAVRSFSTVLNLMEEYPEYVFMSSQPQLYKYVKENAPDVYERIKERVAEGRWETEGGMFLEADCNLISGESLIRQFIHGKKFFKEEFGVNNEILWLPDVFGYSAALPQIMEGCGIKYFMTTKISWNEINKLPYDTFMWEGIDGTEILTHFSPTRDYNKASVDGETETEHFTTYNANINPSQVKGAWERYSQKDLNDEVLMSFGYGDGGGGPTRKMLENQRRLEKGIPSCPKTKMSHSLEFFKKLEENVGGSDDLPKWVGELYLEYHRGTYTSMARNKKSNRKSEFMLQNSEFANVLSHVSTEALIEQNEVYDAWEVLLRNQFHDILPGSSIKEVYDESKEEYDQILMTGYARIFDEYQKVANAIVGDEVQIVVFNPNSTCGNGIVEVELIENKMKHPVLVSSKEIVDLQPLDETHYLGFVKNIPSKGYQAFNLEDKEIVSEAGLQANDHLLENDYVRVNLNEIGQISSIYDKVSEREVLKENECANVLMTYEDRPHNFDNWDINNYYIEKGWEVTNVTELKLVEKGPVRATIKIVRTYLDSIIVQYVSLSKDSSEIEINNDIDWKEHHVMMKSLIPVDVHSDEATYEIQYGNVKRKTHYNTSWDVARFEVCMHKWMDISEDDFGVSVMNDCKYGCSVHEGVIGLTMLKSGTFPNPDADKERHQFKFTIYPHKGTWKTAKTIDKAYALNNPMCAVVADSAKTSEPVGIMNKELPKSSSLVSVNKENVIIEVVKPAYDEHGIVIRMYEAFNRRTKATLCFGFNIKEALRLDMLENVGHALKIHGKEVEVELKPYEIKTIMVKKIM